VSSTSRYAGLVTRVAGLCVDVGVLTPPGRLALSLPRAALRAFAGLALAPLWLIGLAGILLDPRPWAWHDRIFGTVGCYHERRQP
jgi:hypothetical protein